MSHLETLYLRCFQTHWYLRCSEKNQPYALSVTFCHILHFGIATTKDARESTAVVVRSGSVDPV
jgi:hypothetical protein